MRRARRGGSERGASERRERRGRLSPICLGPCYAMPGTRIAYGAAMPGTNVAYGATWPGTHISYGATRGLVLT
eukprot:2997003-Rhodomonas_salina.1